MGFHEFSSPYDWSRIAAYKRTAKAAFGGMIDLSVGSPVDPVPDSVRKALAAAANDPNAYGYPATAGTADLRAAIAEWFSATRNVDLQAIHADVVPTVGSKEGVALMASLLHFGEDDVVVITSGIPRKPGMTREELIGVNAGIVKSVAQNILKYSPNAILVVISNPMDTMTYLSLKSLGIPKNRIIGMGGALDSSRFKYFLSQALGCNANEVEGMVIGGHGDTTMIPLARLATYKGIPVSTLLSAEKLDEVVASTMVGGATLTKLLGTSAWYAPGAAGAFVVESIIHNQGKMVPCSVYLEGEYGESDICCGVPVILGKNGIEKIVELPLNEEEKAKFAASAAAVRKTNAALHEVGAL